MLVKAIVRGRTSGVDRYQAARPSPPRDWFSYLLERLDGFGELSRVTRARPRTGNVSV
jgi:hypothetical protein